MDRIEILFHTLMIIALILLIILIIYHLGNEAWLMNELKNKCIAECTEVNKLNPYTCVC